LSLDCREVPERELGVLIDVSPPVGLLRLQAIQVVVEGGVVDHLEVEGMESHAIVGPLVIKGLNHLLLPDSPSAHQQVGAKQKHEPELDPKKPFHVKKV
jgi:hypothetical protein